MNARALLVWVVGLALAGLLPAAPEAARADEPKPPAPKPAPPTPAPPKPAAAPAKAPPPAKPVPAPVPAHAAPADTPPPAPAGDPLEFPEEGLIVKDDGKVLYFYRTNFVTPAELEANLKLLGLDQQKIEITYKLFPRQNVLLIEGFPEDVEIVLDAAAYFDVAAPQVFIEAKVIEITYESNFEFGLDYLWSRAEVGPETLFQGADAVLSPPSYIASQLPGGLPFQGTSLLWGLVGKNAENYGLANLNYQLMELDGKAEVLSKPSIVATQNVEAQVMTNEDRQIITFQRADRNNENYIGSVLSTGVKLRVLPKHIGESYVTMEIEPEVRGVQGLAATTGGTLQPVTTLRSAKTTVTLADGETLVIGGLYTNRNVTDKAKTPFISDIPVLGWLFTRTRDTKVKTELIFMLTPTIVRKTSQFKIVTPPSELERLEEAYEEEDACKGPPKCDPFPRAEPFPPGGPCDPPPTVRSTPLAR